MRPPFLLPLALTLAAAAAPAAEAVLHATRVVDPANEEQFPLNDYFANREFGYMAMAPDGTVGMLFRDVVDVDASLRMRITLAERLPDGTIRSEVLLDQSASSVQWQDIGSVAYDAGSRPHVFRQQSGQIVHFQRVGEGGWTSVPFGNLVSPSLLTAVGDPRGRIHVVYTSRVRNEPHLQRLVVTAGDVDVVDHGAYQSDLDSGNFSFEQFFDFAVDSQDRLNVCFETSEPWGDPDNLPRGRINWARWEGGGWRQEVVRQGENVDDKPAWNGALALDADGVPHVLSTHTTHAETGSMRTSKLYFCRRNSPGSWGHDLIAESADGYSGGDGNKYTGEYPRIAFDQQNNPHIAFSDISSWHWKCIPEMPDISCNDQVKGQVRYAYKDGSTWRRFLVFDQPGQGESGNPLNIFAGTHMAVSPGGRSVYIMGMEHVHHSNTYAYDQEAARQFRVMLFELENTGGDSTEYVFNDLIGRLLGRPVPITGLDRNGDGRVDGADVVDMGL